MGTNPNYNSKANELPDRPKLATLQKVVLGTITVGAAGMVAAPVAIALVCAAEIAELATGGASGGSLTIGGAAVAGGERDPSSSSTRQNTAHPGIGTTAKHALSRPTVHWRVNA